VTLAQTLTYPNSWNCQLTLVDTKLILTYQSFGVSTLFAVLYHNSTQWVKGTDISSGIGGLVSKVAAVGTNIIALTPAGNYRYLTITGTNTITESITYQLNANFRGGIYAIGNDAYVSTDMGWSSSSAIRKIVFPNTVTQHYLVNTPNISYSEFFPLTNGLVVGKRFGLSNGFDVINTSTYDITYVSETLTAFSESVAGTDTALQHMNYINNRLYLSNEESYGNGYPDFVVNGFKDAKAINANGQLWLASIASGYQIDLIALTPQMYDNLEPLIGIAQNNSSHDLDVSVTLEGDISSIHNDLDIGLVYAFNGELTSSGAKIGRAISQTEISLDFYEPSIAVISSTSLLAQTYSATGYVAAKTDAITNVADVIKLSNGQYITHGIVTLLNHGYSIGHYYYLSDTGTFTRSSSGTIVQRLFFVLDANTLLIDVQPAQAPTVNLKKQPTKHSAVNSLAAGSHTQFLVQFSTATGWTKVTYYGVIDRVTAASVKIGISRNGTLINNTMDFPSALGSIPFMVTWLDNCGVGLHSYALSITTTGGAINLTQGNSILEEI
jgi:hypothetical protein